MAATTQYSKLVLLVGPHGAGKSNLLAELADDYSTAVLSLGSQLSSELIELPLRLRPAAAADRAGDFVRKTCCSTLMIVDNIELLFLPELKINPLELLQNSARNRMLVVAWPGTVNNMELHFANLNHPEFRSYHAPEVELLAI